ncbi:MAG: glycosyltransferase family 2 protein [Prolixibacteraceae bacterium]
MNAFPPVEILLATYNGEKYLEDLIGSLFSQTYTDWKLTIRDDGSSDRTLQIINKLAASYPEKIRIFDGGKSHLGSTLSFSSLLENATGNYLMLCDQDDVWFKNKIEQTRRMMQEMEQESGNVPLMVFTDLTEVDQDLNIIAESFMASQKLDPSVASDPVKVAALNVVAGCTSMINRRALDYVVPIPSRYIVHDQWMAVNISKYGRIGYLPASTIFYRQHASNVLGSNKIGFSYFYNKLKAPVKQFRIYYSLLSGLRFRISLIKYAFYKVFFTIKRLFR